MAQENWQKYKLLKLIEMLRHETDEQHPLSTSRICSKLGEMGISCERRTLTKDIAVLNELGYEQGADQPRVLGMAVPVCRTDEGLVPRHGDHRVQKTCSNA